MHYYLIHRASRYRSQDLYDPDHNLLDGWLRVSGGFQEIPTLDGWISLAQGIRFDLSGTELTILDPVGRPFLSYPDLASERDQISAERDRLAAQPRTMGVEPSS